jgi:hypothetical protein
MAAQREVIEPRTHESATAYRSWLRKIGRSTYRFRTMSRTDGKWEVRVDRSIGGRGRHWETVHHWSGEEAES